MTEEQLQSMLHTAERVEYVDGDGGHYIISGLWAEKMVENVNALVTDVRRLQELVHETVTKSGQVILREEKRAVEAEHAAALWMKRAKELEASYEALRLRYAQETRRR